MILSMFSINMKETKNMKVLELIYRKKSLNCRCLSVLFQLLLSDQLFSLSDWWLFVNIHRMVVRKEHPWWKRIVSFVLCETLWKSREKKSSIQARWKANIKHDQEITRAIVKYWVINFIDCNIFLFWFVESSIFEYYEITFLIFFLDIKKLL